MTVRDDYVKEVASKFVKHLENGDIPWSRKKQTQTNFNPVSGHEFAGMNQLVLEMEGMDKGYSEFKILKKSNKLSYSLHITHT